jgi:CDP-diglyceride synthetase
VLLINLVRALFHTFGLAILLLAYENGVHLWPLLIIAVLVLALTKTAGDLSENWLLNKFDN